MFATWPGMALTFRGKAESCVDAYHIQRVFVVPVGSYQQSRRGAMSVLRQGANASCRVARGGTGRGTRFDMNIRSNH